MNSTLLIALLYGCRSDTGFTKVDPEPESPSPDATSTGDYPDITPTMGAGSLAALCPMMDESYCADNPALQTPYADCYQDARTVKTADQEILSSWVGSNLFAEALNGQAVTMVDFEWDNGQSLGAGSPRASLLRFFMLGNEAEFGITNFRNFWIADDLGFEFLDNLDSSPAIFGCEAIRQLDMDDDGDKISENKMWSHVRFVSKNNAEPLFSAAASYYFKEDLDGSDMNVSIPEDNWMQLHWQTSDDEVYIQQFYDYDEVSDDISLASDSLETDISTSLSTQILGNPDTEDYFYRGAVLTYTADGGWNTEYYMENLADLLEE